MHRIAMISAAFAVAAATAGAGVAEVTVAERLAEGAPAVVIAHRSAVLGGTPENSLAWMDYAFGQGVDAVHVNVQVTGDGHYILMHDNTLNRTTDVETVFPDGAPGGPDRAARGGKDYVRDYTLDEIRRLSLTDGTDGGPHPVPTLGEALDAAAGRGLVLLGLKSHDIAGLAAALEGLETGNVMLQDLFYSATDPAQLLGVARETGLPAAVALADSQDFLRDLGRLEDQLGPLLRMVCTRSDGITPAYLARMAEIGARVCISGWRGAEDSALVYKDDPGPWREALEKGHAALTDHPEAVLALRGH